MWPLGRCLQRPAPAQVGVAHPLVLSGPNSLRGPDPGISIFRVKDGLRKQIEEEHHSEERSKTDLALIEEALRYGNAFNGMLASGFSSSPFFFSDRTPMGEYYDFSGAGWEKV